MKKSLKIFGIFFLTIAVVFIVLKKIETINKPEIIRPLISCVELNYDECLEYSEYGCILNPEWFIRPNTRKAYPPWQNKDKVCIYSCYRDFNEFPEFPYTCYWPPYPLNPSPLVTSNSGATYINKKGKEWKLFK